MRRPAESLTDEARHEMIERAITKAHDRMVGRFGHQPRTTKHNTGMTKQTVASRKAKNRARRKAQKRSR